MYVEPLYIQAENIAFPELKQVIVADAKRVVMKDDFRSALDALLVGDLPDEGAPPTDTGPPTDDGAPTDPRLQDVQDAIEEIRQALDRLEQALEEMIQTEEGGAQ